MEEICIARLAPADMLRLRLKLGELNMASSLEDIFWLPLPRKLFNEEQQQHQESCGPYFLALEADRESGELRLETLVRGQNTMHCVCIAPAEDEVVAYITTYLENILRDLRITRLNRWEKCHA